MRPGNGPTRWVRFGSEALATASAHRCRLDGDAFLGAVQEAQRLREERAAGRQELAAHDLPHAGAHEPEEGHCAETRSAARPLEDGRVDACELFSDVDEH